MRTILLTALFTAVTVGMTLLAFTKSPVLGVVAAVIFVTWWIYELYQLYSHRKGGRK